MQLSIQNLHLLLVPLDQLLFEYALPVLHDFVLLAHMHLVVDRVHLPITPTRSVRCCREFARFE